MQAPKRRRHPAKAASVLGLLTITATWLWAHEGHQALPTKGAQVDAVKGQINLSPDARSALDVKTEEVGVRHLEERLTLPALLVAPWQGRAVVTTRLAGRVTAVHVQPGEAVAPGQALADVQSIELENLQVELLQAANEARLSTENLNQLEEGFQHGAIPEKAIQEARSKDQQRRNELEIARRKLLILGVADTFVERLLAADAKPLTALPVTSPIAGVVTRTEVRVGQVVDLPDHLFDIVDPSSVWVKMDVLEKDLPRIATGQSVELHLVAYPAPGDVFRSTIQVKGLSLDPKTHQGAVWSELSNLPGRPPRFLPGMYGQAEVILSTPENKTTIPAAALIHDGAERFVLVEEGPGQYVRQAIVVGRSTPEWVEVRSGQLFPGDRVVTVGSHELASLLVQGVLRLSPQAAMNIGLHVAPAQRKAIGEVVPIRGVVELPLDRRGVVSARLPGTIRRLLIDRDQVVHPGEVLAEVNSLEFQNLQLELLRSHLECQLNDQILRRLRPTVEIGALPERQLREAESAARSSAQRRDSFRRRLEVVGLSDQQIQDVMDRGKFVEALPVRAPIGGTVVRFFHAGLGHAVKAEELLFEIHNVAHPVVRAFVSERQLLGLRVGQPARIRLLADPTIVADARLVRSSQAFGEDDRTLSVWLEPKLPPSAHRGPVWLPGMLTRSTLVLAESEPMLAVPREAVLREGTQAFLFVQKADGSFERRPVETGRSDDAFVAVTAGLREGEAVAVRGVVDLQTAYTALK
jgi:RND family efflux transporter MFP subunit